MPDLFFIVGSSRSGTTLLSRILKNHADTHVLNETHFFEEFSSQINEFSRLDDTEIYRMINLMLTIQRKDYYRKSEYQEYPEQAAQILNDYKKGNDKSFKRLIEVFFENEARTNGKKRAGDQTPRHVFYVDEIISMYPGAKIIHMVRDPRSVLYSQKKKWASGLRQNQPLFEVIRTFLNYHPITMSLLWCKAVTAGLSAEKRYGREKVKTLIFEQFVKTPESNVREICEFLGESFRPDMLDVTVELSANLSHEGTKGISKAVAHQWEKKLSKTEVFFCEKIGGHLMAEMGYPLSGKWPNFFHLGLYTTWFPFHLGFAFLMNLGRMGNPFDYVIKRFIKRKIL